jgi:hypothetical protein
MKPKSIHDALRHIQSLTSGIARDMEEVLANNADPTEFCEYAKAAALDAHMLVTWVRDNLKNIDKQ